MALLDRFRSQSRHKHADPAVRLAFVQEIPIDERELLSEIIREDDDPKVRRAAVAKMMDPAVLAPVAAEDADEAVRAEAVRMLRDLALDNFEGTTPAESLAAVDALPDMKAVAAVAKSSTSEAVAALALARVVDAHALASIARHAVVEAIRVAAFARVHDPAECLAVALNCEFKDPAVAAVERLESDGDLERVANRARSKPAAKRARAILREREERVAAAAAAAAAALAVERAMVDVPVQSEPEISETERLTVAERERAEADLARLRDEQAAVAQQQHDEATEAARAQDRVRREARLAELVVDAEQAAGDADLPSARRRLSLVRREWKDLVVDLAIDPHLAARYAAAESSVAARDAEAREQDAHVRREALAKLQEMLARVEPMVNDAQLSLAAADRALRDIRAMLGTMPPLPSRQDYDDIMRRMKDVQTALTPKVQEMRDAAEWQRWANVAVQEQLCAQMEALRASEDPDEIARQVKLLQQQWQRAANVPRSRSEMLWKRFKAAHDDVWAKCESHFAAQAHERTTNLERKVALCDRVEAIADSTDWIKTADEIKALQAEWKTIGAVTRGQEKAIWERFRGACDRFFTRRQADLSDRKKEWAANLARKEDLCVKVEALADSSDWETTAAEIRRLQAEWKTIGPVRKNRSEAIWQRFRSTCDRFFARYAQRHEVGRAERVTARETVCVELEAAAGPEDAVEPAADLLGAVRTLRGRWQQELAKRGVDREQAVALDERFHAAFSHVVTRWPAVFAGTELDLEANKKRMDTLVRRIEELAASLTQGSKSDSDAALSPTTRLAAMLKEALAANTIGGKADDHSRLHAAAEELRQAQASWTRIGPVAPDVWRTMNDRFQRACRRVAEKARPAESKGRPARA